MLPKEELDKIKDRINYLLHRTILPTENSRLNEPSNDAQRSDFVEALQLYKLLVDEQYPVHSRVRKTIEDYLLLEEAIEIEPKYLDEDSAKARFEKVDLLKSLAHSIYYDGECLDDLLDDEEKISDGYSFGSDVISRSNKALKLLDKANSIVETAEVYCFKGEIFFNAHAYKDSEESFRNALKVDKYYANAYTRIARLIEVQHCKNSALLFLKDALDNNIDILDIRIYALRLCHELAVEAKEKGDDQNRREYITLGREQEGILKDKFRYDPANIFDDEADKKE